MSRPKRNQSQSSKQEESAPVAETVLVRKNNGSFVATAPDVARKMVGSGRAMYASKAEQERRAQSIAQREASERSPADNEEESA